jgi:hypothetical protein
MLSAYDNNRGGFHPTFPDIYYNSSLPQKFTGKKRDETASITLRQGIYLLL